MVCRADDNTVACWRNRVSTDQAVRPFRRFPVEVLQASSNRAACDASKLRHQGDAAPPGGARLTRSKQPQSSLIEMASHGLVAHTNGVSVDHALQDIALLADLTYFS